LTVKANVPMRMQPIAKLVAYCGDGNPVIVQEFRGSWRTQSYRKRASASWLRKLRAEGVSHVAVRTPAGTTADFTVKELLSS
jgi:hypothetical protein